jgi:hypothetical protein
MRTSTTSVFIRAFLGFDELLEVLEAVEPHGFEVLGQWAERGAVGAVEVLAAAFGHEDEVGLAENAKVLRHCSKCDVSVGRDLASGSLFVPDELEDLLAARLCENGEGIDHDVILVYTKIRCKPDRRRLSQNRGVLETFDASK